MKQTLVHNSPPKLTAASVLSLCKIYHSFCTLQHAAFMVAAQVYTNLPGCTRTSFLSQTQQCLHHFRAQLFQITLAYCDTEILLTLLTPNVVPFW